MSSKYSTPSKSQTFYLSTSSPSPKKLSQSELKSLELQALDLLDTDIGQSKALLETCLRSYDELTFPPIENIYLHYLHCDICTRVCHNDLAVSSGEKVLKLVENLGNDTSAVSYEARTLQLLGIVYSTLGNYSKSVYSLQKLLKLLERFEIPSIDSDFVKNKVVEGLIKSQKPSLARPYLEDLLKIERSSGLLLKYGKVLMALEELESAVRVLEEASSLESVGSEEKFTILTTLALVQVRIKDFYRAEVTLKRCIELVQEFEMASSPESLWVYSQLGQIYYTEEEYEKALNTFKTSLMLSEDLQIFDMEYGTVLLYLGKIHSKFGQKAEALTYLNASKKVFERFSKENGLEANLAILEVHLKEKNVLKTWEVLQDIEKTQYSPLISALAENEMGNLLREFGHLTQSIHYYESALTKYQILKGPESPEVGKVLFNLGSLSNQLKKFSQALEYLSQSQKIKLQHSSPTSADLANVYLELGLCLTKLGKKAYGQDLLERGKKILKDLN